MDWWKGYVDGDTARMLLAGAFGGMVRWIRLRESVRDGLASIVVGAVSAVYLGPLGKPIVTVLAGQVIAEESSRTSLSGFLIGLIGGALTGGIIDAWRLRKSLFRLLAEAPAAEGEPKVLAEHDANNHAAAKPPEEPKP